MFNLFKKDPDSLLKQATAKKNDGELDQAIELLRKKNRDYFRQNNNLFEDRESSVLLK